MSGHANHVNKRYRRGECAIHSGACCPRSYDVGLFIIFKTASQAHVVPKILTVKYGFCDVEDLVVLIADMISELIQTNGQLPLKDCGLT
jgi:hypothetical protein